MSLVQLFGFPIYKKSLKNEDYDRDGLLDTIQKNYDKDNNRNKWATGFTDMHHSVCDDDNTTFEKPNYQTLLPLYNNCISEYLNSFKLKNPVKYNFRIVNYTCMTNGQYMEPHVHSNADFTGVHYIQYDSDVNNSTTFDNSNDYAKFISTLRPSLIKNFDENTPENSFLFRNIKLDTNQDDVVIFPAVLTHSISKVITSRKGITVIFNFDIE
jgi:hypothetical protein